MYFKIYSLSLDESYMIIGNICFSYLDCLVETCTYTVGVALCPSCTLNIITVVKYQY